ncbi:P-loop containing nucleoside triphosphate hydrolase protein [Fomitopsis serialis]|uniref:P-loop containing nucleoside triphosphate hydrolase protein n=1 Tax=Fomitopsis serialis TaxID=139415 RepID=UPI002007D9C6|nr:P-loop containing nucleoside triphosphate hydrolase protein [Neoantrodia serialis]KAH9925527.1 P-loop containing nucleoside triphosphate hydrolase protein [Neoantrodia serialis]
MRKFNAVVLGGAPNVFIEQYNPTIEEEYRCELIVDGHKCVFTALNEKYLKNARGFLLVFSLTQESSLRDIENLRQQIYLAKGSDKDIPIVVVGTKLDLSNEREVSRATIHELAESWKLPFYETSAKRNWHVTDVFEDLVRQMRKHSPDRNPVRSKLKKDPCIVM